MLTLPKATRKEKSKFWNARIVAKKRGIGWLLTFNEWWQIWQNSGRWYQRGTHRGQYVMARNGDKGPYAVENVSIILSTQNLSEAPAHKNNRHHAKLTLEQVNQIRSEFKKGCRLRGAEALGRKYGVWAVTIRLIVTNARWKEER